MAYTQKERLALIVTASLSTALCCIFSIIRVLIIVPSITYFNDVYYPFSFLNPFWTLWFFEWLTFIVLFLIVLRRVIYDRKEKGNSWFKYLSLTVFGINIVAIYPFTNLYGLTDSSELYLIIDLFSLIFLVIFLYKTIFEKARP